MKEEEIRPEKIFSEYLSLANKDADTFFRDVPFYKIPCPACGHTECTFIFQKSGFNYEECPVCNTLFANPRPSPEKFNRYYEEAPSIQYWASHFYKQTENSRRTLLIKPKAKMVKEIIERNCNSNSKNSCILDIGAGYGVFCEELQSLFNKNPVIIGIEPSYNLEEICKQKGVITVRKFFEDITINDLGGKEVVAATSFELLEHLQNPTRFLD